MADSEPTPLWRRRSVRPPFLSLMCFGAHAVSPMEAALGASVRPDKATAVSHRRLSRASYPPATLRRAAHEEGSWVRTGKGPAWRRQTAPRTFTLDGLLPVLNRARCTAPSYRRREPTTVKKTPPDLIPLGGHVIQERCGSSSRAAGSWPPMCTGSLSRFLPQPADPSAYRNRATDRLCPLRPEGPPAW